MSRGTNCKTVTIFEGPDGSGKSTTAQEYALATKALYVHHGPYKNVTSQQLARLFFESMLPALHGHQDVVLDRCWLSEPIYGAAFRRGQDRVGLPFRRMLERAALRCGAVVINCRPPLGVIENTFLSRREEEYLDNTDQLRAVYFDYEVLESDLHEVVYDYTKYLGEGFGTIVQRLKSDVELLRSKAPAHPLKLLSSGNLNARVVVVGETFTDHRNGDPLLQLPFQSFDRAGCSAWLAEQLDHAGISEQTILWANASMIQQRPEWLSDLDIRSRNVIALGNHAAKILRHYGVELYATEAHPQYHKRFRTKQKYPLINTIREAHHEATSHSNASLA